MEIAKTTWKTEIALANACAKGERAAQEFLYKKYSRDLYAIAYRFSGGDVQIANDLLQESFIRIFEKIDYFRTGGSLWSWLKTLTVNQCINKLKYLKNISFADADQPELIISDQGSAETNTIENMDCKLIMDCLNQLPSGYRTIINLHAIEGYSYTEISKILGIEESTARSQYLRAKTKFAGVLEKTKKKAVEYVI